MTADCFLQSIINHKSVKCKNENASETNLFPYDNSSKQQKQHCLHFSTPQCNKNNHHNAALHNSVSVISIHSFIHRSSLVFMMYEFVIIIQDLILIRCNLSFFPLAFSASVLCFTSHILFLLYKNIKFMLYFFSCAIVFMFLL